MTSSKKIKKIRSCNGFFSVEIYDGARKLMREKYLQCHINVRIVFSLLSMRQLQ